MGDCCRGLTAHVMHSTLRGHAVRIHRVPDRQGRISCARPSHTYIYTVRLARRGVHTASASLYELPCVHTLYLTGRGMGATVPADAVALMSDQELSMAVKVLYGQSSGMLTQPLRPRTIFTASE